MRLISVIVWGTASIYFWGMEAIRTKLVVDERGRPQEVIISWAVQGIMEALGRDLDEKAKLDLRATRRDLKKRNAAAFKPLSAM